jgi:hypothetical protein
MIELWYWVGKLAVVDGAPRFLHGPGSCRSILPRVEYAEFLFVSPRLAERQKDEERS